MPSATKPPRRSQESLKGIPYENTAAAKPPIPISITHPSEPHPNKAVNRLRKSDTSHQSSPQTAKARLQDDRRKDSGVETPPSSARTSRKSFFTDGESASTIRKSASLPSFRAHRNSAAPSTPTRRRSKESQTNGNVEKGTTPQKPFMGILTEIPTGSFEDLSAPGRVDFSKRGSMLLGGRKAVAKRDDIANGKLVGSRRNQNGFGILSPMNLPSRMLSADEEALSNKVRSMYEDVPPDDGQWPLGPNILSGNGHIDERASTNGQPSIKVIHSPNTNPSTPTSQRVDYGPATERIHSVIRQANEAAGGIEDWEDINNADVDRYGFIIPRKYPSPASSTYGSNGQLQDPPRVQRTSTLLQLASETPRRSHSRLRKPASSKSPARGSTDAARDSRLLRPNSSQSSHYSTGSHGPSRLRNATNRLPHNKNRRRMDEASDMLTLPPGLADIAEDLENGARADEQRKREFDRDEKWRKMAKIIKNDAHGGGMQFEFDTRNPKLIERTWKGIPDKWRATAWHSFLTTSAKKRKDCPSDEELKAAFAELVDQPSPEDVQIDIDVPRTISSHIMFRRRYRGGQRLLFRVLHCMSIYFPDTGYVQGMAALVATLLCYFDEEMSFVMMVRLWQLRGLEQLYRSGFEGLMAALEEFERDWLGKGEVSKKLNEHGITSTAYGTRWYLTLFNYSIPFPAQLRVWDIFMLLGEPTSPYKIPAHPPPPSPSHANGTTNPAINPSANGQADVSKTPGPPITFNHGLDILHATSAALIDGMREILLDSDFENAMKVLTSWIPVRDEEMLMMVVRCEWKMRGKR